MNGGSDGNFECQICGAAIGNSRGDFLGSECRKVYTDASWQVFL